MPNPKLPAIRESEFTTMVLKLAKLRGWKTAHFRPGLNRRGKWSTAVQGDGAGWPDLFAVHERHRPFAAELKVGKNKTTPEQVAWLNAMRKAGIRTFVWTEKSWADIEAVLEGRE